MAVNEPLQRTFGAVKWIGGFNKKTNRENAFGFIESIAGEDIFVHKASFREGATAVEGDKVSFTLEQSERGPKAGDVWMFSPSDEGVLDLFEALKAVSDCSKSSVYLAFQSEAESALFALQDEVRQQIIRQLFSCKSDVPMLDRFLNQRSVYRDLLQVYSLEALLGLGVSLQTLPGELIEENEEDICRLICSGRLTSVPSRFLEKSSISILYACALVDLGDSHVVLARRGELDAYLRDKFMNPSDSNATLYKDIFDDCIKRIGGYKASPAVWDILSELLLKKFLFERDFHKAGSLYNSAAGLPEKIDCFIVFNLAQLLAAGNDLSTTYNVFVHMLWQELANRQLDVEAQVSRVLSLFPSCGTVKLLIAPDGESHKTKPGSPDSWLDDELFWGTGNRVRNAKTRQTELSCEAVYWEKQNKYLCRGSVCSSPQIRPDPKRNFLEYTIYDWLVHFGVEFWDSDNHQVRDFPIKLAGYFNRLREILSRLHCRRCNNLMLPDFKYSRVKCSVYENGQWVEKDMAAAYRNTLFYCNDTACSEFGHKYYINHCLESRCYDLIDSRDLKVKCDSGLLVCEGCGSCCPQHGKTNPVGFCPECGAHLQLYEDPGQVSPFGRNDRFVRCSNQGCSFELSEPGLPKKFYLKSSQPVHIVRDYS